MKPKILCPECQTELSVGVENCPGCGRPVEWNDAENTAGSESAGQPCPSCGTENNAQADFCSSCGAKLRGSKGKGKQESSSQRPGKNRDKKKETESAPLFSSRIIFGFLGILVVIVIAAEIFSNREKPQATNQFAAPAQQMQMPAANMQMASQIAELEKQLEANPGDTKTMLTLANLAHDGRFYDKAIATYKRYLEKIPKDPNARVDLGICYYETDKLDDAEKEMKAALKYDPKHLQAHFNLGIVTLKARKLKESNEWFKKTIEIAPPNSEMGVQAKQFLEQHSSSLIQNK